MSLPLFHRTDPDLITYPDVEGPRLTEALVRHAEEILGVRLPQALLAVLRDCNGGYLVRDACPTTDPAIVDGWVPVSTIAGITDAPGSFGVGAGLLATPYLRSEWGLDDDLVLLDGDGHTWVALDYGDCGPQGEPHVIWIDLELAARTVLASDFSTFLSLLAPSSTLES